MNIRSKTLALALLLAPNAIFAATKSLPEPTPEIRVKFGGWSKHLHELPDVTKRKIQYNESHNGIGVEYILKNATSNTYKGVGMMYMKDSFDKPAFTLGASYGFYAEPFKDLSVGFGGIIGLQDRSYIETVAHHYMDTKRTIVPFVAPEITFSYKSLGISTIVFPHVVVESGELEFKKPVIFTQAYINF
ncbi:hypothetical protein [Vibrio sp. D431a]|uniref:hypothetical protein n=1 Tax=Vibrio sp. D431a TaxID=2837388 RepID=UPI0025524A0F|nr:hypothetical protein [Vibrio sp. D431a]MDK9793306.1 hypothetical protein [Vibrio sp. D431a]